MRLLLVLLILCSPAFAATYYVDWTTGSDSNPGTISQPFKNAPGQTGAAGVAAAVVLAPGDVVAWKGGETHVVGGLISAKSGVTYDGGLWGTGWAILDGQNRPEATCISIAASASNTTIKRLTIQNFGGYPEDSPIWTSGKVVTADAATDTFTSAAHDYSNGTRLQFTTTGTFPGNVPSGPNHDTYYYVINAAVDTFQVSTTSGGAVRDITSNGSGTITAWVPITDPPAGGGINISNTGITNATVEDCLIQEIGQWQNVPPLRGTTSVTGTGIVVQNANGVTIRNVEFTKAGTCLALKAQSGTLQNVVVDDCYFHDYFVWGIDVAPRSSTGTFTNIEIKNCRLSDYYQFDYSPTGSAPNWQGFGEKPHTDGIFVRGAVYGGFWNNVRIHSNRFWNEFPQYASGTGTIYVSQGPSVLIYNNLFYNISAGNGVFYMNSPGSKVTTQTVRVYNNTFVNCSKIALPFIVRANCSNSFHFANNIYVRTTTVTNLQWWFHDADGAAMDPIETMDYNIWFNPLAPDAANLKCFTINNSGNKTIANIQALSPPFEVNGMVADPLLVDTVGTTINDVNFRPLAGSPALLEGINLSEYFTTDIDGNSRPASGAWTIGAYQDNSETPADVTAPTLLDAYTDTTGAQVTMVFSEPVQGINLSHYVISGHSLSTLAGSGTTWTFALSPVRALGANFSTTYTSGAGRTRDLADNLFASGTYTIRNLSLADTPNPPTPGRRGGSGRGGRGGR